MLHLLFISCEVCYHIYTAWFCSVLFAELLPVFVIRKSPEAAESGVPLRNSGLNCPAATPNPYLTPLLMEPLRTHTWPPCSWGHSEPIPDPLAHGATQNPYLTPLSMEPLRTHTWPTPLLMGPLRTQSLRTHTWPLSSSCSINRLHLDIPAVSLTIQYQRLC